jgi:pimeloyl-ACP methyl ester carboxylesterase
MVDVKPQFQGDMMASSAALIDIPGARLLTEVSGQGEPLVLLHGFSLDLRMWDAQVAIFAERFQVIRYDLRGFGRSTVPTDEPYRHVEDLRALLAALGLKRAHVMGLSMGGGIAADFALAYPDLVNKLVLVDSTLGGYRWSAAWDAGMKPIWRHGRAGQLAEARSLWLADPLFGPVLANAETAVAVRQMVEEYSGWHWCSRDPGEGLTPPANERLSALHTPTLVVVGELDLPDFQQIATQIAAECSSSSKVTIPGAGHMANMEAPVLFAEVVLGFLQAG